MEGKKETEKFQKQDFKEFQIEQESETQSTMSFNDESVIIESTDISQEQKEINKEKYTKYRSRSFGDDQNKIQKLILN